ncbi:MAG: hypothetical protein JNN05_11250, partial [Candidatus Omnitrophica bacterium]|nr:hypothetical protein [Candidatus Omnitrophota bacterium]
MIRTVLYSLLIVLFFAAILAAGLLAPEQGRKVAHRILEFIHWKPAKKYDGVLAESQDVIRQFNDSHANIQLIRQMTLDRSKKSIEELEVLYKQTSAQFRQLLSDIPSLAPAARKELFEKF